MLVVALAGDLRQVSRQVLDFRWSLFPLVLVLTLFNYALRFIKWHYYLRLVGVHDLPVKESGRMFVGGFPLAVTPGKLGEALKGVWLKDASGIAIAIGVSVVVAERISDGLAVMALSSLGVVAYPQYWPAFAIILAALLGVVIISQIRPLAYWLLGIGERIPLVKRFAHSLRLFYEGSFTLFRPKALLVAVGLGTISWLGEGLGFFVILLGLGVPASLQTAATAVFVLSFSIVIGAASTLPAGLGVSEASIAAMLAVLLQLEPDTSVAATLLIRFATLWFGVALGLMVWAFSRHMLGMGSATQKSGMGTALENGKRGKQHATR